MSIKAYDGIDAWQQRGDNSPVPKGHLYLNTSWLRVEERWVRQAPLHLLTTALGAHEPDVMWSCFPLDRASGSFPFMRIDSVLERLMTKHDVAPSPKTSATLVSLRSQSLCI
ncbi:MULTISPECIES: hypothetical protein [unclassified Streptomyces]|uniref:hypothetical protein n=1 Tax=unclassified Streptomyces TaxID=2593676 RepID=UPI0036E6DE56